ncbi:TIGR02391 family protein [Priestia megaterium]|uniref:TIGR02391 family protein n=1 Tax=Priestia megaterium TaxID=1404 RepID=UPI0025AFDD38|nr:TIGR02391 family protein [Priestia megaterium]MDN3365409.1 TIGR02391 family protein [Priestia megaterium]
MDLERTISSELWATIQKNYENASYKNAILDAMHLLTETIRNKTGLEGDGHALVGSAFGGENPKIQLNKLQTESEKNVQNGMQELLRGLYRAIRNPRSHDSSNDSVADADAIIHFIDYILKSIEKSKLSFEKSIFLQRVFDSNYVKTSRYSELLVKEIPIRQRPEIAIAVILGRKKGDIYSTGHFLKALVEELDEQGLRRVFQVVSEELKYTDSIKDISTILHAIPGQYWLNIDEAVRLRIEHQIYKSLSEGRLKDGECETGHLATWITAEHLKRFDSKEKWMSLIVKKYLSANEEESAYIRVHLWKRTLAANREEISYSIQTYFSEGLKQQDDAIINEFKGLIQFEKEHPWWESFKEELKEHPEIQYDDIFENF